MTFFCESSTNFFFQGSLGPVHLHSEKISDIKAVRLVLNYYHNPNSTPTSTQPQLKSTELGLQGFQYRFWHGGGGIVVFKLLPKDILTAVFDVVLDIIQEVVLNVIHRLSLMVL